MNLGTLSKAVAKVNCSDFDPADYWDNPANYQHTYPCPLIGWHVYQTLWLIGGLCAIAGASISLFVIFKHLYYFRQPHIQKHIIRILWIIPIYAANSWISAVFRHLTLYVDVARDVYEAYALYNFFHLLIHLGGGNEALLEKLDKVPPIQYDSFFTCALEQSPESPRRRAGQTIRSYPSPFCYSYIKPGKIFFHRCRQLILQFVYVKVLVAASIFILSMPSIDKYHEGSFNPKYGYLYIVVFYNISIFLAMYFLVFFYEATKDILHEFKPISKFLCIKAILFFSFWQSVALSVMNHFGWIKPVGTISATEFSNMIQDSLICFEMLPLSIAFALTFGYSSYKDFAPPSAPSAPLDEETKKARQIEHSKPLHRRILGNLFQVALPVDVLHETKNVMQGVQKRDIVVGNFFNLTREEQEERIIRRGWLKKLGEDVVNWWTDRYCLLISDPPGVLCFKRDLYDPEGLKNPPRPQAFIDAREITGAIESDLKKKTRFDILTPLRTWHFDAPIEIEKDDWIHGIKELAATVAKNQAESEAAGETAQTVNVESVQPPELEKEVSLDEFSAGIPPRPTDASTVAHPLRTSASGLAGGFKRASSLSFERKDDGDDDEAINDTRPPKKLSGSRGGLDRSVSVALNKSNSRLDSPLTLRDSRKRADRLSQTAASRPHYEHHSAERPGTPVLRKEVTEESPAALPTAQPSAQQAKTEDDEVVNLDDIL